MDAECNRRVFLILLRDRASALRVRDRLLAAASRSPAERASFLVPPADLQADDFFSGDPTVRERVALWWDTAVGDGAAETQVVALVDDGVAHRSRLDSLAGCRFEVDEVEEIRAGDDGDALCDLVLDAYAGRLGRPATSRLVTPGGRPRAVLVPDAVVHAASRVWQEPGRPSLATLPLVPAPVAACVVAQPPRPSVLDRARRRAARVVGRGPRELDLGRHAQWLVHPDYRAPVVIVTNPKGGPGKTTTAIGVALILNEILETAHVNARVVLVDGNTKMSDTFRSMPVDAAAPTVRELTTLLRHTPTELPALQYANSRARNLVVLREQEDSGGYQLQEIQDLTRFLRQHFCAIVVDLVNDRPGTGSPTERLVQWWMTEASVAVIPTKANINDLEGAERMVDALDGLPAVVAYIQPPQRDLDGHPRIQARLETLRARVADIHVIPEDYRVRTAALDNLNLVDAAPRIREAFADLTLGILAVHADAVFARLCAAIAPAAAYDPMALR